MLVSPIEKSDRATFLKLNRDFYSSGATHRGYDETLSEKTFDYLTAKHENLWGYIIRDAQSSQPAGYALATTYWCNEDGGNVVILDELYVAPEFRHKGFGVLFLRFLEENFADKAVSITLEVVTTNTVAKSLYNKEGFTEDGFEVLTKTLNNVKS